MLTKDDEGKKKNSRERILKAATNLFGRRGYHATRIEDLTRAAGISRGALYWHFDSKSDVLAAVVERLRKEYLERFIKEVRAAGPVPMNKIWSAFKFNARFGAEHTDLVHCLRNLSLELSPSEDNHVRAFFRILERQRNFIVDLIKEAQEAGNIRTDLTAETLAAVILAIHDGILLQWAAFKNCLDGRELAWSFRQVILAGMASDANIIHPKGGSRGLTKIKRKRGTPRNWVKKKG
ncbi:MAG: TetR/AcrR family transcriptional regulator [Deltaproteobacteria bacterium]|nr:TetR/AcrR family transcriptional regulator [Deltaproteobacteria bacterium]MBW2301718.1 TetR/AcrR family transcriptional regulator [Deltaproteobacteria bacterium]